ncbi:cobalamin biosynthesis protein [Geoglobus sp.]
MGFEKDVEKLEKIASFLEGEVVLYRKDVWRDLIDYDAIVALMPSGIVVRGICGLLRSKWEDPAVIVVDKGLRYAVPVLGGHHGGNEIAKRLEMLGMKAVITTAMEYEDGFSVGVGYRKGVPADEIISAIERAFSEIGESVRSIRVISTWVGKRGDGVMERVADHFKRPLMYLGGEEINSVEVQSDSRAKDLGLNSVSEACALYFSRERRLVLPKRVYGGVTVAIAR